MMLKEEKIVHYKFPFTWDQHFIIKMTLITVIIAMMMMVMQRFMIIIAVRIYEWNLRTAN